MPIYFKAKNISAVFAISWMEEGEIGKGVLLPQKENFVLFPLIKVCSLWLIVQTFPEILW